MEKYNSVYGNFILQYIAFKRSLGYKYKGAEFRFRVFDRFAVQEGCEQIGLTKEFFEKWMELRPNEIESNRYRRVNELINFSRYLNDLGIASYCPKNIPHIRSSFSPYIFTHDEINRFFAACDERAHQKRRLTGLIYATPALFRLLYGTGVRINEALQLETNDVNLDDGFFLLRRTKNRTERKVPFSDSVKNALRQYSYFKEKVFGSNTKYFFSNVGDTCWSAHTAYEHFRSILVRAKISHTEKGPRLHDLRHTFSVHTLAEMSSHGMDLYYSLPILSKYLGHASLEATEHYVRLTAEMYPELLKQANQLCAYVFPEVSDNEI